MPPQTDAAVVAYLLSPLPRKAFKKVCDENIELLGTPASSERRAAQKRKDYLQSHPEAQSVVAFNQERQQTARNLFGTPTKMTTKTQVPISELRPIPIVPDEANIFGIIATQNEAKDAKGVQKEKLTIRIPLVDPKDIRQVAGKLAPDGSGLRYTQVTASKFGSRPKNVDTINQQITGPDNPCENTKDTHMAYCNALASGEIKKTIDCFLKFPQGSTYNNFSFNDSIHSNDPYTLELKSYGIEQKTGETCRLSPTDVNSPSFDHLAPMAGVAFEVALDTDKREKKTRLQKKVDEATKLLNNMQVAADSSDSSDEEGN